MSKFIFEDFSIVFRVDLVTPELLGKKFRLHSNDIFLFNAETGYVHGQKHGIFHPKLKNGEVYDVYGNTETIPISRKNFIRKQV